MSCEHRAREIFNGPQMRTMNRRLLEENFDCLKPVLEEKTPKSDVLLLISQCLKIRTTRKQSTVGKKLYQFVSNFQVYLNNICLKSCLFSLVFDNRKIFRFPKTKVVERT